MKIAVIGSGFGGLSAAIRLSAQGHDVTILEKLDKPGGRAYVFEQDGFTFDAGPTIITAPWLIDELFELAGKRTEDYVSLVRVDPFYNVRFPDGSVFRYNGDRDAIIAQIRAWSPRDVEGYERFAERAAEIFETGMALIATPFLSLGDMARILPDLVRLRSDRSVAKFVEGYVRDDRLRQLFSFHPLLVGGNPFHTTNIYALIHTLEQRWGVWFAMGGMGSLVRALATLFSELGGTLRLSAEVEQIEMDDATGRATGVRLAGGERIAADAVVSNADVAFDLLAADRTAVSRGVHGREARAHALLDVAVRALLRHEPAIRRHRASRDSDGTALSRAARGHLHAKNSREGLLALSAPSDGHGSLPRA